MRIALKNGKMSELIFKLIKEDEEKNGGVYLPER
jgi:hypothetical protein